MKKLKNTFSVFGSGALRRAFSEELLNLGLQDNGECSTHPQNIMLNVYKNSTFTNNLNGTLCKVGASYTLPHDWDKALAAAQDYEEVWPKYGKFISPELKHLTENKIYKLTREINIGMSDHCYEFINDLGEGDAAHITHFEIVHEEGYLKQEAEPKVGDWVVVVDDSNDFDKGNWSGKKKGDIFLVGYVDKSLHSWIGHWVGEEDTDKGNGISINQVRKATEEEIKKATEIKVGDIVVCISNTADSPQGAGYESGLVFTVIEIKSTSTGLCYFGGKYNNGVYSSWIRKATPQEIEAFKDKLTLIVSGYQAEVMNGKIAFGCQHLSKQTLLELHGVASNVEIQIGDTKITRDLLTKLINKL